MSVTYTAVLPTSRTTVQHIAHLLQRHRRRLGTRTGRRILDVFAHAVLICRYLLDAPRTASLARDNGIGVSTCYRYLHEALDVLAAQAPRLRPVLLAAHAAGHTLPRERGDPQSTSTAPSSAPTASVSPARAPPPRDVTAGGWTCGGRASTTATVGTSKW